MIDRNSDTSIELARLKKKELRSWIGRLVWWTLNICWIVLADYLFDRFNFTPSLLLGILIYILPMIALRYLLIFLMRGLMWTWDDQRRLETVMRARSAKLAS